MKNLIFAIPKIDQKNILSILNTKIVEPQEITLNTDREDIQQILGHPPGWTLRWGISVVFIAVLIFLIMGWLIKYPDVIEAEVKLVTPSPPVRLFTRTDGKVERIFFQDGEKVNRGPFRQINRSSPPPADRQFLPRQ